MSIDLVHFGWPGPQKLGVPAPYDPGGGGGHSRCTWARFQRGCSGGTARVVGSWAAFCCFYRSALSAAANRIHHTTQVIASHIHQATGQAIRPIALAATRSTTTRRIMRRMISSTIGNMVDRGTRHQRRLMGSQLTCHHPKSVMVNRRKATTSPPTVPRRMVKSNLNTMWHAARSCRSAGLRLSDQPHGLQLSSPHGLLA